MADIAEVRRNGIARVDRPQRPQHPKRLVNREEVVGEPLDLKDRQLRRAGRRAGLHPVPERILPVHRAISLDPVDDRLPDGEVVIGFGPVDDRIPHEQVRGVVGVRSHLRRLTEAGDEQAVEVAELDASRRRRGLVRPAVGNQRVEQVASGGDRNDGPDLHRLPAGARERGLDRRQPGVSAAIRSPHDRDGCRVGLQAPIVDHLRDHASQNGELHAHIAEVGLAPRFPEAPRRVA